MIIGLTGGIATGKSTVSEMFKNSGIPIIDTDIIARNVVGINQSAYYKIIEDFGRDILLDNNEIDRKKLGSIIFKDEKKREVLNQIVHPEVRKVTIQEIKAYQNLGNDIIVIDVPLLFESGFDDLCDLTLVVYTDIKTQYERLMKRNNLDFNEAKKRIEAQMPLTDKVKMADYVIDNSYTLIETHQQFLKLLENLVLIK